jgi:hypothetical protein
MIKIKKVKTSFNSKDRTKTIRLPCYDYDLDIFDIKILIMFGKKNMNKHDRLYNRGYCEAKCCDYLESHREINMFFKNNPNINTITHECVHACDFILKYLRHNHPNESNELNANLTGHLVDVVLKAQKKYNKGSKK